MSIDFCSRPFKSTFTPSTSSPQLPVDIVQRLVRTKTSRHRRLNLEPISVNGQTESIVRAAVKTEYFPNQLTVIPNDGDKVMVGDKELIWHAVDTNDYNVNLYYFARAFGKTSDNALFWAVTIG